MYPSALKAVMVVARGPTTRKNRTSCARADGSRIKASKTTNLSVFILVSMPLPYTRESARAIQGKHWK